MIKSIMENLEFKKLLGDYCFPNFHIGNRCTFDWNVILDKLFDEYPWDWNYLLDYNNIYSEAFPYKVKFYISFVQPYNMTVNDEQIVKMIQNATEQYHGVRMKKLMLDLRSKRHKKSLIFPMSSNFT